MYKTEAEVRRTVRGLIAVSMNEKKDIVDISIRNAVDCPIANEERIDLLVEDFVDLISPILRAKGYRMTPNPEVF